MELRFHCAFVSFLYRIWNSDTLLLRLWRFYCALAVSVTICVILWPKFRIVAESPPSGMGVLNVWFGAVSLRRSFASASEYTKKQVCMRIGAESPKHTLRPSFRPKLIPLLDTRAWALNRGICANAICIEIARAGQGTMYIGTWTTCNKHLFKPRQRHCVVLCLVLVQSRKTRPTWLKKMLTRTLESNQTNK